ncbi:adaptor protein MecA [Bacillus andreraoultii]|uniref:adaptor protein MecA n=1 Tax=Bacillus andreraoultii TaxID=1499685 RepID=UPI00053AE5A5|nr:adaptor protein MecA [Bacillus andreraoultii]
MRLERVGGNQINIFLTFEELAERGFTKEDVEYNTTKWHQLFFEMIDEASEEFEKFFDATIVIDVYALQTQGMVVSFTLDDEDVFDYDPYSFYSIEWWNIPERHFQLFYRFPDIENVIQFAHRMQSILDGGSLYHYKNNYYLHLTIEDENQLKMTNTIISDYGERSSETIYYIKEYGNCILNMEAIEKIIEYFKI